MRRGRPGPLAAICARPWAFRRSLPKRPLRRGVSPPPPPPPPLAPNRFSRPPNGKKKFHPPKKKLYEPKWRDQLVAAGLGDGIACSLTRRAAFDIRPCRA